MAGYAGGGPGIDIVGLALQQVDAIVRTLAGATATNERLLVRRWLTSPEATL